MCTPAYMSFYLKPCRAPLDVPLEDGSDGQSGLLFLHHSLPPHNGHLHRECTKMEHIWHAATASLPSPVFRNFVALQLLEPGHCWPTFLQLQCQQHSGEVMKDEKLDEWESGTQGWLWIKTGLVDSSRQFGIRWFTQRSTLTVTF